MRDRLLDVDVFAGLHRAQRNRRVPVVRRGDDAGVHIVVLQHIFISGCSPGSTSVETRRSIRPPLRICFGSTSHSHWKETLSRRSSSPRRWCAMMLPQPMMPSRTVAGRSAAKTCTPPRVVAAAMTAPASVERLRNSRRGVGRFIGTLLGSSGPIQTALFPTSRNLLSIAPILRCEQQPNPLANVFPVIAVRSPTNQVTIHNARLVDEDTTTDLKVELTLGNGGHTPTRDAVSVGGNLHAVAYASDRFAGLKEMACHADEIFVVARCIPGPVRRKRRCLHTLPGRHPQRQCPPPACNPPIPW